MMNSKETTVSDNKVSNEPSLPDGELELVEKLREAYRGIREEMSKVIVGQDEVLEELITCVFARGHVILEGVPGLAKTLIVSSLARCLDLDFARIQFTPDLMPSDITGTEVIQEDRVKGTREFKFLPGPIFANVILADEINRTPPKTQSALLEAMQERQVSVGGRRFEMKSPFFVLATQNPIEQEGTYPLPEAQQDRFMYKIRVDYPRWEDEFEIVRVTTASQDVSVSPVLDGETIERLQEIVRRVPVADHVIHYCLSLVRSTRVGSGTVPDIVRDYVSWGAGPRACQYLVLAGKVRCLLHGRCHVSVEDIQVVARPVLRHRICVNFNAEAEGYTPDRIIDELIALTPAHESALSTGPAARAIKG